MCDSHREEVASLLTHALGTLLSVVALVVMLVLSEGEPLKIVSAAVFGTSLILLYASSTLYHFFTSARWKARFQSLDHACIYLLIAGSYTPITLVTLRGATGWWLFGTVWSLAILGVLIKTLRKGRKGHWISTTLYLAMGWLILFAFAPLVRNLPMAGVWWLVAGGLTYSFGIIFYAWNRLPFNHAIWHLFVMGGSSCHVLAVARYVLP
ncbi:hemolysin III family protein [Luteolibacter yonseiensis]|uniref:Hemolysin III family protein n=1 Tax=Luteolibacter yonseiensis TaxID=1144680 RepID=A0A934R3C2_9BACT|nr:hemolysin III family protein [Luteolibacter yonseiensis]MBK1816072.1 hemolysin III family protein [Luteolibacter yonseiensis]